MNMDIASECPDELDVDFLMHVDSLVRVMLCRRNHRRQARDGEAYTWNVFFLGWYGCHRLAFARWKAARPMR